MFNIDRKKEKEKRIDTRKSIKNYTDEILDIITQMRHA